MRKSYLTIVSAAIVCLVSACGSPMPPTNDGGDGGEGGAVSPYGINPCADATDGTICYGQASAGIHGECVDHGCDITEWTCLRSPMGTTCQGGHCATNRQCCSGGCLQKGTGLCLYGAGLPQGGICP